MTKLKIFQKPSTSNVLEGANRYIEICMLYDNLSYKCDKCNNYKEKIIKEIIHLKKNKTFKLR